MQENLAWGGAEVDYIYLADALCATAICRHTLQEGGCSWLNCKAPLHDNHPVWSAPLVLAVAPMSSLTRHSPSATLCWSSAPHQPRLSCLQGALWPSSSNADKPGRLGSVQGSSGCAASCGVWADANWHNKTCPAARARRGSPSPRNQILASECQRSRRACRVRPASPCLLPCRQTCGSPQPAAAAAPRQQSGRPARHVARAHSGAQARF